MRIKWREWGVTALAWVAVLGLGGMALAGAESGGGDLTEVAPVVLAQEEGGDPPGAQGDGEGHAVENHGRCVSTWVHRAKDAGLKGKAKSNFMKQIAQDETAVASKNELGATCDFEDELAAAVAAQGTAQAQDEAEGEDRPRGKSGGAPGKSKSPEAGSSGGTGDDGASEETPEIEVPLEPDASGGIEG